MFLDFFFKLKDARIPVTLSEFFTFLDTVKLDFIQYNTENFYYKRACAIVEGQPDPIDNVGNVTQNE